MGVYIKGMEMPKACVVCPCACEFDGSCHITGYKPTFAEWYEDGVKDCPLVPVSPHGRLIDADALNYSNTDYCGNHLVYLVDIDDAPTIIPAEEDEDD